MLSLSEDNFEAGCVVHQGVNSTIEYNDAVDTNDDTVVLDTASDQGLIPNDDVSSTPIESWCEETEREKEATPFTTVVSKSCRKSMRKAVNTESREAYILRTKGILNENSLLESSGHC